MNKDTEDIIKNLELENNIDIEHILNARTEKEPFLPAVKICLDQIKFLANNSKYGDFSSQISTRVELLEYYINKQNQLNSK